jgi:hypothetical protein
MPGGQEIPLKSTDSTKTADWSVYHLQPRLLAVLVFSGVPL